MKSKICIALSVIMIMVTLLVPMTSWAAPEKGDSDSKGTQTTQKVENSKDSKAPQKKTEEKAASGKKENKTEEKNKTAKKSKAEEKGNTANNNNNYNSYNTYNNYQPVVEKPESNIKKGEISIIFSHDMHSHFDSESRTVKGKTKEFGGIARAVTVFNKISPTYKEDSFLFDAGDFSMGSGYQTIFKSEAAEYRMLGYMGYDAVTLGNHEFDYGSDGLAKMLNTAVKKNKEDNEGQPSVFNAETQQYEKDEIKLPTICVPNIDWKKSLAENKDAEKLQKALKKCKAADEYTVIKKNGIKIAVFGIFGENSIDCSTEGNLSYKDQVETAKKIVKDIKANEKGVKLIVCLSHSGTDSNPEKSEDELLAKAVPDIDLIISGHTHTKLKEPIIAGDTVIASCGEYNGNIGYVTFKKDKKSGSYKMDKYKLYPLSSKVEEDEDTVAELKQYRQLVNKEYFSKYGYSVDQVIAKNNIEFSTVEKFGQKQGEETLGDMLSDSYIYAIKKTEGSKYEDVDVAIVPKGVVRSSLHKGNITAGDAFNVFSSGAGADGTGASPLICAYLTGRDLKNAAEVDATVSDSMIDARLYFSGLSYKINTHRLMLNRAFDIQLMDGGKAVKLENDKLYRVVTDLYTAQMLSTIEEQSKGLLAITPVDKNGAAIEDFDKCVVKDGSHELKAWQAVAIYLEKMGTVDSKYAKADGRKTVSDSRNIRELVCQPNKVGWMLRGAIILVLLIILLIIFLIFRRKNGGRSRRRRNSRGVMTYTVSERQKKAIFAPPKKQKNLFADSGKKSRRNRRNGRY